MLKNNIAVLCIMALAMFFTSCEQEVLEPGQMIQGNFVLEDETGLSSEYISFDAGELSVRRASNNAPYLFAEGKFWRCSEEAFNYSGTYRYNIQSGMLSSDFSSGPVELDEDKLQIGGNTYKRLEGFEDGYYSSIEIVSELTLPYISGEESVPFTVSRPVPAGKISTAHSSQLLSNVRVVDGYLLFKYGEVKEDKDDVVRLVYASGSLRFAEDQSVIIRRRPSTSIDLSSVSNTVAYTGQSLSIPYSISGPVEGSMLSVTCNALWVKNISVTPSAIECTIDENPGTSSRQATFTLSYSGARDVTYVLTQDWAATGLATSPSSLSCDYTGGFFSFIYSVQNPRDGVVLTATSKSNWISDASMSGNTVSYKVAENNTSSSRIGEIELAYGTYATYKFKVTQNWATTTIETNPESKTCEYTGGNFSFTCTIENPRQNVSLAASSTYSWITDVVLTGNTVSYKVAENNSGAQRTGKIKLTYGSYVTAEFTVTQNWSATSILLTPSSATTDYTGGAASFDFAIQNPREGITCTATSQANWITGVSISGTKVNYTVSANSSSVGRQGKIKLTYGSYATNEFVVNQTGKPVVSLTLNKSSLPLLSGESDTLVATVDPSDAPLQWSSSSTSVATVDQNGKVSAVGNGTATITVKAGEKSATCTVTVTTAVTGISLNKSRLSLYAGGSETLVASVAPSTASNKSVIWSSNKTSVATVDQNGKVTAVSLGTATITVTTVDGNKTATCSVAVIPDSAVDLGLSVCWASCNVGENGFVSSPEQYGAYYAWGETETKTTYNYLMYKFRVDGTTDSDVKLSKYNTSGTYGDVDNRTVLELEDDVASVKLGGKWRMPTKGEFEELLINCKTEWVTYNGKDGYKFTSKKSGFTDKWVFLPAAGSINVDRSVCVGERVNYWTSLVYEDIPTRAWLLVGDVGNNNPSLEGYGHLRYYGRSIRPVYDPSMDAISGGGIDDIIYEEGGKE